MWAALLANAASSKTIIQIRPGFIAVLKQMATDEAALLNWMYDFDQFGKIRSSKIIEAFAELGFGATLQDSTEDRENKVAILATCLGGLEASQLISAKTVSDGSICAGLPPAQPPRAWHSRFRAGRLIGASPACRMKAWIIPENSCGFLRGRLLEPQSLYFTLLSPVATRDVTSGNKLVRDATW